MSDSEIRTAYRQAARPRHQITVLAEFNACSKDEIRSILGVTNPNEQIKITFSSRLQQLKGEQTVEEFSRECGLPARNVNGYLNRCNVPTIPNLITIAKATGVSLDWLLGVEDYKDCEVKRP